MPPFRASLEEFVGIPGKGAGAGRAGIRTYFCVSPPGPFGLSTSGFCPLLLSSEDSRYKMDSSLENSRASLFKSELDLLFIWIEFWVRRRSQQAAWPWSRLKGVCIAVPELSLCSTACVPSAELLRNRNCIWNLRKTYLGSNPMNNINTNSSNNNHWSIVPVRAMGVQAGAYTLLLLESGQRESSDLDVMCLTLSRFSFLQNKKNIILM